MVSLHAHLLLSGRACSCKKDPCSNSLKLRANGHNILDQQHPTLLDVRCWVPLHTLLHFVGCCCCQTFSTLQTGATLLANKSCCWMLHVASACTPCCILLDVVSCCWEKFETCQTFSTVQTGALLLANQSQHCCANNVGSCCARFGSGLQTDATTPNNVGTCSA